MVRDSEVVGEEDRIIEVCAELTGPSGGTALTTIVTAAAMDVLKAGKSTACIHKVRRKHSNACRLDWVLAILSDLHSLHFDLSSYAFKRKY